MKYILALFLFCISLTGFTQIDRKKREHYFWIESGISNYNIYADEFYVAKKFSNVLQGFKIIPSLGVAYATSHKLSFHLRYEYTADFTDDFSLNGKSLYNTRKLYQFDSRIQLRNRDFLVLGLTAKDQSISNFVYLFEPTIWDAVGPKLAYGSYIRPSTYLEVGYDVIYNFNGEFFYFSNHFNIRLLKRFGKLPVNSSPIESNRSNFRIAIGTQLSYNQYRDKDYFTGTSVIQKKIILGVKYQTGFLGGLKLFINRGTWFDAEPVEFLSRSEYIVSNNIGVLSSFLGKSNWVGISYFNSNESLHDELNWSVDSNYTKTSLYGLQGFSVHYERAVLKGVFLTLQSDIVLTSALYRQEFLDKFRTSFGLFIEL